MPREQAAVTWGMCGNRELLWITEAGLRQTGCHPEGTASAGLGNPCLWSLQVTAPMAMPGSRTDFGQEEDLLLSLPNRRLEFLRTLGGGTLLARHRGP